MWLNWIQIKECSVLSVLCIKPLFQKCFWCIKGTASNQSTPQAKPGPWKWDLCGSQLITAPIEVSPRFYTGKAQRVPTPWVSEDLNDCERHHMSSCPNSILIWSNQVTWLKMHSQACWSGVTKRQQVAILGLKFAIFLWTWPTSSLGLLRIHQSITVSSLPKSELQEVTSAIYCSHPPNLAKEATFPLSHLVAAFGKWKLCKVIWCTKCWNRTLSMEWHFED